MVGYGSWAWEANLKRESKEIGLSLTPLFPTCLRYCKLHMISHLRPHCLHHLYLFKRFSWTPLTPFHFLSLPLLLLLLFYIKNYYQIHQTPPHVITKINSFESERIIINTLNLFLNKILTLIKIEFKYIITD